MVMGNVAELETETRNQDQKTQLISTVLSSLVQSGPGLVEIQSGPVL